MNPIKKYFPLMFALIFATLASVSVYHYLSDRDSVSEAKMDLTVPVVTAKHDLLVGTRLSEEDLTVENWPQKIASDKFFQRPKTLIGRTLKTSLGTQEPLTENKLLAEGENLSTLIPAGKRAVTVSIPRSETLAKLLERNSLVDVIAMFDNSGTSTTTRIVAQSARVLAVHNRINKADSGAARDMEVMLVVKPNEAAALVIAINKGIIQIVVRNSHKKNLTVK